MALYLNSKQAKEEELAEAERQAETVGEALVRMNAALNTRNQALADVLTETFNLVQALKVENAILIREIARLKADDDGADDE